VVGYSSTGFLWAIAIQLIPKIHKKGGRKMRSTRKKASKYMECFFKNEISIFMYYEMTLWRQR
jgi:hypothetical protein